MTRGVLIALVVGVVLAVFGPDLLHLGTDFLGLEYVDHYGTQWFYWYTERQLRAGEAFGHTDLFFHPWGKDVFAHTGSNVLDGIVAVPFRMLFGGVLGYNLFVFFGLAVSAWAFYRLVRDYSEDRFACGVATLLFSLSPSILHDLSEGRPTQAILVFPILFMRSLLRARAQPGWRWPLVGGLCLALTGYQYWYYALFFGLAALASGLLSTARPAPGGGGRLRTLLRHALMAAVAVALVAPVAVPLIQAASGDAVPGLLDMSRWSLRSSPPVTLEQQTIGLYAWQPLRRWGGFHVLDANFTEHFLSQGMLLPWVWAPLMGLFLARPRKLDRGVVVALALSSMVIATGSIILLGAYAVPNPIFIALTKALSFMQRLWWPGRAIVVFVVVLGMVIAELLTWAGRFGSRVQLGAGVLLCLFWLGDLRAADHVPFPRWDATIPAGYRCLAQGPPGAIIELPHAWTQAHLYYQTFHHRPMMGGMLENNPVFTPDELLETWENNSFLRELHDVARLAATDVDVDPDELQAVSDLGYRYIVLQKDAYGVIARGEGMGDNVLRTRLRQMQRYLRLMVGTPVYEDARVVIYDPWGDQSPCVDDPVQPDTQRLGGTEIQAAERIRSGQDSQVLKRVWDTDLSELLSDLAPPEDDGEDTGGGQDTGGGDDTRDREAAP